MEHVNDIAPDQTLVMLGTDYPVLCGILIWHSFRYPCDISATQSLLILTFLAKFSGLWFVTTALKNKTA